MKRNKKLVRRIMKLFGLEAKRRRKHKHFNKRHIGPGNPNLIKDIEIKGKSQVWVSDFTRINYRGKELFFATVLDVYTRVLKGWGVGLGSMGLIKSMLESTFKEEKPKILHSDQGSEYYGKEVQKLLKSKRVKCSMSMVGSPWENGYQEGFYSQFKLELGEVNGLRSMKELGRRIEEQVDYYNHRRIHSALKMSPKEFEETVH
jgi:putative transposase